jgi:hypothetical protein
VFWYKPDDLRSIEGAVCLGCAQGLPDIWAAAFGVNFHLSGKRVYQDLSTGTNKRFIIAHCCDSKSRKPLQVIYFVRTNGTLFHYWKEFPG